MENKSDSQNKLKPLFAAIAIPVIIVASVILYLFVLGNSANFADGNAETGHPLNYLGTVYKGGLIVPILMSFFLMVITFSIERFLTIQKAYGTGSLDKFLRDIKHFLNIGNISAANQRCMEQKGSVGNVVISVLKKYEDAKANNHLTKEQKTVAVQKEIEEATSLELPMLEKNLTIIATLASISTLAGLLGTVIGMIKAFAALATAGAPDAVALANGISEALINTALGIATSALAIISYNYFTNRIDTLTYSIDEIGFSISQNVSMGNYKEPVLKQTE